ncbi:MAG TPA: mucoidy inhibitor MuiA family protein, partial [Oculatellaceae cyanobacterium]
TMAIAQLTSRIDSVKVYAAGATITRVADIQLDRGDVAEHVEIAGLPLALDDSSIRVRVEADGGTPAAIATDVRVGLAVPPRQETTKPPIEEEVRDAENEVQRLEDAIALIDNEINILYQLDVPKRPDGEQGKAPPPSPIGARLALANFKDEQVRARITERRETQEKLRTAREHLEDLQQKQARASSAREVRPHELRKTVVVRLSYEGEPSSLAGQQLVVEYFVPGARWTPTYVCRLDSTGNQATLAVRALICQRTGEDWSGVRLELSTAEPMTWCELPELPSLRLGRAQSMLRKSGWRLPPVGAQILFEDFDRQKDVALTAVFHESAIAEFSSPFVPELPNLAGKLEQTIYQNDELNFESFQADLSTNFVAAKGSAPSLPKAPQRPRTQRTVEVAKLASQASQNAYGGADEYDITLISPEMIGEFEDSDPTSQIPIEELQLSVKAYNILKRAQINSIADLLEYSQEDLLKIKHFNHRAAAEVTEALQQRLGITLPSKKSGSLSDRLAYNFMRLGAAEDKSKRGKLSVEPQHEAYLEFLKRQEVVVRFNLMEVLQQAVTDARNCIYVKLPPGGINVREVAGSFDYAYRADGRIDVPSDGEFHSVALTSNSTDVDLRYVVVPREDTNVFRIAQLKNPLQAPLLTGSADVYVDGEYILSTNIATVPPKGQMELGLGVEQAIKVARNTTYQEVRSSKSLVAFNELRHEITIDIANRLPREAHIEVRERLPIPE